MGAGTEVDKGETSWHCDLHSVADKIPTAPRNLVASFVSNRIKIAWEKPSRNADKVTSYTVYYNFSGNPQYQTETLVSVRCLFLLVIWIAVRVARLPNPFAT